MKAILLSIIMITMANTLKSQAERSAEEANGLNIGAVAPVFSALDADCNIFFLD
jgi:hypothetical protein